MKLYHATKSTTKDAASEVADLIERDGFKATFDPNYNKKVVCFADRPLTGWGGWQDAWVVVDIPESIVKKYHSDIGDDMVYGCRVYAFPQSIINQFPRYATVENELKDSPMWEGVE